MSGEQLEQWHVFCGECALEVDERHDHPLGERPPCPECGNTGARYARPDGPNAGRITVRISVEKKPSEKRRPVEELHGEQVQASTGRWMLVRRLIDRRNNRYYEKVVDQGTREVLREIDEPLTEHRGRGSAKRT